MGSWEAEVAPADEDETVTAGDCDATGGGAAGTPDPAGGGVVDVPAGSAPAAVPVGTPAATPCPTPDVGSVVVGGWVLAFSCAAIASCSLAICCSTLGTFFALG